MQAWMLVAHGNAQKAFELQEVSAPTPKPEETLVESEGFGLNFADVMAREGLYPEAPPMPSILGYEIVGRTREEVKTAQGEVIPKGKRVLCFTRFGAYGKLVAVRKDAIVPIPENLPLDQACALATQYVTAYYVVEECLRPRRGDRVLVQAAAGGLGVALVQLLKLRGAFVFGTAGGQKKVDFIVKQGVDVAIDYTHQKFNDEIRRFLASSSSPNSRLDMAIDSLGGKAWGQAYKLLGPMGKMVGVGGATFASIGKGPGAIMEFLGFGFYHPMGILQESKSIIGVNMLRVADNRPDILSECMQGVMALFNAGKIHPHGGGIYDLKDFPQAHQDLSDRKSMGKLAVRWN